MFSLTPHKYLGAAVRPSKISNFLSLSTQGKCPQLGLTPVCQCLILSKRSETGPLTSVSQGVRGGVNHCYGPSGCAALGTAQDALALLLLHFPAARTLLIHTHLAIYKHLQVLSRADPKLLHPSQSSPSLYQLRDSSFPALTLGISLFWFSHGFCWPAPPVCLHPSDGHPVFKHVNWFCGLISSANLITVHSTHLLQITEKVRKLSEVKPLDFAKSPFVIILINPLLQFSNGQMPKYLANNENHSK